MLTAITNVFTEVGAWIASAITDMMPVFYSADGGLTFIGTMAVAGLSFAVILMILAMIRSYMRFS